MRMRPTTKLRKLSSKIGSGITPHGGETTYLSDGIPFIRSQNVLTGLLDISNVAFISSEQHKKMSNSVVKPNDVLLNITGASIGRSCIVPETILEANVNQHVCVIRLKSGTDSRFLSMYLNSLFGQKQIWSFQGGGSREGLNYQQIGSFDVPIFAFHEQTAIANLLSIWDLAIEKVGRLIAAKERRYLWFSKKQLFGDAADTANASKKTKWFSVPDHWKIVNIGKVASEVSSFNNSGESIPVLSCTKYDGLVDSLTYFDKQVFSQDTSTYKVVAKGQFAYATNHIEEGSIGYQDVYDKGLVSPMYTVFETNKDVDDNYLYKVLKSVVYLHIFRANTSSSVDRRGSLRWKEFAKLPIPLPPIEEQKEIAAILTTARQEIDLLKKQADAYRKQKRGLMQRLLTGEWRVRVG